MSKGNILIVDDTLTNLQVLTQMLIEHGYKVRPARNGKLALKLVQSILPDLILLDIKMPEMDGYQVCKKLKANDRTRDIPIIFISALNKVFDKVKAFSLGGVDYITKPFQVEEVLVRIETHLQLRQLQQKFVAQSQELQTSLEHLKITHQKELIQSKKLATLGQMVAEIAHEINNPLSAIKSSLLPIDNFKSYYIAQLPKFLYFLPEEQRQVILALIPKILAKKPVLSFKEQRQLKRKLMRQLEQNQIKNVDLVTDQLVNMGIYDNIELFLSLLKSHDSEKLLEIISKLYDFQAGLKTIEIASKRASRIVIAMKNFCRFDKIGTKVMINIVDNIETVLIIYQNYFKRNVNIIRKYDSLPLVMCYADEINQVWMNLIYNALQAMHYKGTLTIEITQQDNQVAVSITDSGEGIAAEIKDRIFEPFFTSKPAGEGSGLGLDIVKQIVEKHEGKIVVASKPGETTFTIFLPIGSIQE
jgi:signal transduction histidine kinase